jgi:hypothetical protein
LTFAKFQNVQQQVRKEMLEVTGGKPPRGAHIPNLKYLEACFYEVRCVHKPKALASPTNCWYIVSPLASTCSTSRSALDTQGRALRRLQNPERKRRHRQRLAHPPLRFRLRFPRRFYPRAMAESFIRYAARQPRGS